MAQGAAMGQSADDFEENMLDSVRDVECEVEERLKLFRRLQWRKERWGEVMLTEREYTALVIEREIIIERAADYRRLSLDLPAMMQRQLDTDKLMFGSVIVRILDTKGYYA